MYPDSLNRLSLCAGGAYSKNPFTRTNEKCAVLHRTEIEIKKKKKLIIVCEVNKYITKKMRNKYIWQPYSKG